MLDVLMIVFLCLAYARGKRVLTSYQYRQEKWRDADACQRERIVREECALRVIGRFIGAGGLAIGALTVASPGLAVIWALVAWRAVKPIKAEMRDACAYRSIGTGDEPPFVW
jgi:hypothetical protein